MKFGQKIQRRVWLQERGQSGVTATEQISFDEGYYFSASMLIFHPFNQIVHRSGYALNSPCVGAACNMICFAQIAWALILCQFIYQGELTFGAAKVADLFGNPNTKHFRKWLHHFLNTIPVHKVESNFLNHSSVVEKLAHDLWSPMICDDRLMGSRNCPPPMETRTSSKGGLEGMKCPEAISSARASFANWSARQLIISSYDSWLW